MKSRLFNEAFNLTTVELTAFEAAALICAIAAFEENYGAKLNANATQFIAALREIRLKLNKT